MSRDNFFLPEKIVCIKRPRNYLIGIRRYQISVIVVDSKTGNVIAKFITNIFAFCIN